jgi:hypothetical protein
MKKMIITAALLLAATWQGMAQLPDINIVPRP